MNPPPDHTEVKFKLGRLCFSPMNPRAPHCPSPLSGVRRDHRGLRAAAAPSGVRRDHRGLPAAAAPSGVRRDHRGLRAAAAPSGVRRDHRASPLRLLSWAHLGPCLCHSCSFPQVQGGLLTARLPGVSTGRRGLRKEHVAGMNACLALGSPWTTCSQTVHHSPTNP